MKDIYKQILRMLGVSLLLGGLAGLIFGYLYDQYLIIFVIAFSISITVWLFNSLLYIFLLPKINALPRGKKLLIEIPSFFATSFLGFIISVSVLSKILKFGFFREKIFLINLALLLLLYMMISGLVFSFRFFKELKEKEIAAEKLRALAVEAELKALKAQINPHFLFNTLNSISALITHNPELSRKMIAHLSELLRISLENHDKMFVPLKKELDFVHLYLEIEKIRFKDKMSFCESIDAGLLEVCFPTMVLQPLLENAVKHGIAESRGGGNIKLVLEREGNLLKCHISNTTGKIRSGQSLRPAVNGTGLENIRQRLNLLFKEKYSFQAGYSNKNTFEVSLLLPLLS
jgi:sensor histidine kinase YesM